MLAGVTWYVSLTAKSNNEIVLVCALFITKQPGARS